MDFLFKITVQMGDSRIGTASCTGVRGLGERQCRVCLRDVYTGDSVFMEWIAQTDRSAPGPVLLELLDRRAGTRALWRLDNAWLSRCDDAAPGPVPRVIGSIEISYDAMHIEVRDEAPAETATEDTGHLESQSISAMQPTAVLQPRAQHYFAVRFRNMEPCPLSYQLTEQDSGHISADGVYTAPGREGVYEIRIQCADAPLISTYAYAIVKSPA